MKPYYFDEAVTLYLADSRDLLSGPLGKIEVDLLLTDPPYAISQKGVANVSPNGTRRLDFFEGDHDWLGTIDKVTAVFGLCLPMLAPHASIYSWLGHRQFGVFTEIFESHGYSTRFLVWSKLVPPPPAPGSGWPSGAELCLYAFRPGRQWTGNFPPSNVIISDSYRYGQPGKVNHPTQKPPSVISPLIAASTKEGDLILDPFAGSGTTLVVAKEMRRQAIGVEIREEYAEIAAKRLEMTSVLPFDLDEVEQQERLA